MSARLEDLTRGAQVKGVRNDGPIVVVDTKWFGTSAIELTFKDAKGRPGNELLYRTDEPRLEIQTKGATWNFDADGHLFRLVSEAYRIRAPSTRLAGTACTLHEKGRQKGGRCTLDERVYQG